MKPSLLDLVSTWQRPRWRSRARGRYLEIDPAINKLLDQSWTAAEIRHALWDTPAARQQLPDDLTSAALHRHICRLAARRRQLPTASLPCSKPTLSAASSASPSARPRGGKATPSATRSIRSVTATTAAAR